MQMNKIYVYFCVCILFLKARRWIFFGLKESISYFYKKLTLKNLAKILLNTIKNLISFSSIDLSFLLNKNKKSFYCCVGFFPDEKIPCYFYKNDN